MSSYFVHIKRYSWVILACLVLATGVGAIVARTQPTVYQATSILLVHAGTPDTTYLGGPPTGVTSTDNLGIALNYTAEIPTRSVMDYVIKFDPELQKHQYTADKLILDVIPSAGTTVATISLLATATHPADAVLLANDMAKGFADYIRAQNQARLDALRKSLQSQISTVQQQKANWEGQIAKLPTNSVPQYTIYTNNLTDTTHILDTLQAQLQLLPVTINGDVSVIQLVEPKDVTTTAKGLIVIGATAGVGLLVGFLIMLLVIFLDNLLRNDEEVKEKLGLAYLGGLSTSNDIKKAPTRPTGAVAHQLSDIAANLRLTGILAGQKRAPQGAILLVTSPRAAEGKTTLVAGLAATMASGGGTVVVIDGNLAEPSTHLTFGISATGIGLSGLLKGAGSVDDAVIRSSIPSVWLLPAGAPMENATLLLERKLPGILSQLRTKADLVIIDGPALLSSAVASILATMVDAVALIVDARHEKLALMLRARKLLDSLTYTPIGIVINHFARRGRNFYYATAYPGKASPEGWVPVQTHAGNGCGNGQKPELMPAGPMVIAPAPAPSGSMYKQAPLVMPPGLPNSPMMQGGILAPPSLLGQANPSSSLYPGKSE